MRDIFLNINGIKGESPDKDHKDDIQVLWWKWGMTQTGTAHTGMGAGAGKVKVGDLEVYKKIDKSTPNLIKSCCNGKQFKEAVLTERKPGEKSLEYLKIKMYDVLISKVDSGGVGEEDTATEIIALNFAKVEVEYTPQKSDGSGDAAVTAGWDIAANTEL